MEMQNSSGEIRLSQKQIMGITGCLITFVGAFMPIVNLLHSSMPALAQYNDARKHLGKGFIPHCHRA